jgi:uncharacterized protein
MRPRPCPDELSAGFWEAVDRHMLSIQRCSACNLYQHPPQWSCDACGSLDLRLEEVSGDARVHSWVTTYRPLAAGFHGQLPYTAVCVGLVEQDNLYLLTDLPVGVNERDLEIGAPARVKFVDYDGFALPQFAIEPGCLR